MTSHNMDPATEAKNLVMIQRIDICAEAILDKATHTALYKFNMDARAWEKTEVDGAMFIYKRVDHPMYSLMIANRQSPEDLIEPILPKIRVKLDKPYIFFCRVDGSIQGLWFYQDEECERIYNLLSHLINALRQEAKISPPPQAAVESAGASAAGGGGAFLTMLMGGGGGGAAAAAASTSRQSQSSAAGPLSPAAPKQVVQAANVRPVVQMQQQQQQQQQQTSYVKPQPAAAAPAAAGTAEVAAAPLPSMLQKLMTEQLPPSLGGGAGATGGPVSAADLERDLMRRSRVVELTAESMNPSASAASLAAFSNQSMHGSDAGDIAELESMAGALSMGVDAGGRAPLSPTGSTATRVAAGLDKHQLAMGLVHLLQTDDQFLAKVHEAYVEALNRRLGA